MITQYRCSRCDLYFRCGEVEVIRLLSGDISSVRHVYCVFCGTWHKIESRGAGVGRITLRSGNQATRLRLPLLYRLMDAVAVDGKGEAKTTITSWEQILNLIIAIIYSPVWPVGWAIRWVVTRLILVIFVLLPVNAADEDWCRAADFPASDVEALPCLSCHRESALRIRPGQPPGPPGNYCPHCGSSHLRVIFSSRKLVLWNLREVDV